ncbi:MAG: hypothetical protein M0Z77_07200 [Thermoplasmatales archaeon]|jgi:hypothetical protein|nr:hypothetical protein [Candidatus Thermoplasmatota archaeon]MDA8055419.1 hypothetical protein [Thermoplasmatales archaeon]
METAKDRKIREAREFFSRINTRNTLFIGISGSVSYEPREGDDIDIFLISKTNRMWTSILEVLMFRRIYRFNDLCLSLCMDDSYAVPYFTNLENGLAVRDSTKVIPISGEPYFNDLIRRSTLILQKLNEEGSKRVSGSSLKGSIFNPLEFLAYVFVASWINLKAIIVSKFNPQKGEGVFNTIFSLHSCYFDTEKYRTLNERYINGEAYTE